MKAETNAGSSELVVRLNPAQKAAVEAPDGPVLVLAGAGSGKTRVIVERLVWLIEERGVNPRNLLALTFTNRAAKEMRERVATRLATRDPRQGNASSLPLWVGTFHSFSATFLRREIQVLGISNDYVIYDDNDQMSLMKRLLRELPANCAKVNPREALSWISRNKQELQDLEDFEWAANGNPIQKAHHFLWRRYRETLRAASALDFDDLLVYTAQILGKYPDVRQQYQQRYRHVLIDEYQDTNQAQYRIAHLLSESHRNLFVVGDEDQSIYSWRGAKIGNILRFEKDYAGAQTYRLEQNYRSTAPILYVANALVSHNKERLGKELWTDEKSGDPVRFYHARDAEDEAQFVVDDMTESSIPPDHTAVLYRTNGQSRVLEEMLRRKGIRYTVVGGVQFYARKEVKDLLAYLRLLINPDDTEAVRRIINVPPRGMGATSLERLEDYARERNAPLLHVLRDIEHDHTISGRAREAALKFIQMIDDLTLQAKIAPVEELAEAILTRTRYREFVQASDEKDSRARLEVVDEFLIACEEFDEKKRGHLPEFLQDLALYSEADDLDEQTPALTLMTCHGAKGLEFDSIYLIGFEEGLLPHAMSRDSDAELEEERRLCYVAMTRARQRLTLTAAESRSLYGETSDMREVSRFMQELPLDRILRVRKRAASASAPAVRRPVPPRGFSAERVATATFSSGTKPEGLDPASEESEVGGLRHGTLVRHATLGDGYVMYTQGAGKNLKAKIRFKTGRVSTFLVSHTPLEILKEKKR